MREIYTRRLAGLFLGLLAISVSTVDGADKEPFPKEARKRLDYAIGKWKSKTEHLDNDGNVTKTDYSTTRRSFVIDDRVVEIVGFVDGDEPAFRAWEYYDVKNAKYTLTSVDSDGQLWTMKGDLGDEFIWTAIKTRNGTSVGMRFTHYDFTENSFTALGEYSRDGGKSWKAFTRQFLTRIKE